MAAGGVKSLIAVVGGWNEEGGEEREKKKGIKSAMSIRIREVGRCVGALHPWRWDNNPASLKRGRAWRWGGGANGTSAVVAHTHTHTVPQFFSSYSSFSFFSQWWCPATGRPEKVGALLRRVHALAACRGPAVVKGIIGMLLTLARSVPRKDAHTKGRFMFFSRDRRPCQA